MVFEPTFDEIDQESVELPDQTGDVTGDDSTEADGGIAAGAPHVDEDETAVAEGEATAAVQAGDVTANDLPAYGN